MSKVHQLAALSADDGSELIRFSAPKPLQVKRDLAPTPYRWEPYSLGVAFES